MREGQGYLSDSLPSVNMNLKDVELINSSKRGWGVWLQMLPIHFAQSVFCFLEMNIKDARKREQ